MADQHELPTLSELARDGMAALRANHPDDMVVRCQTKRCKRYLGTLRPVPGTDVKFKCPNCRKTMWVRVP